MVNSDADVRLEICWQHDDALFQQQLADFLQREKAIIDPDQALARAAQAVVVAYDAAGNIVAELDAESRHVEQLHNRFWTISVFVCAAQRNSQLPSRLTVMARDFFAARFAAGHDPEIIGLFTVVQSRAFKGRRNLAVTEAAELVFIGRNRRGDNMRVYYFKDAHIDLSHIS